MNAITTVKIARPGNTPIHHESKFCTAVDTIDPHSAVGGFAPRPRNDRPESSSVAVPMSRLARISTGPTTIGRMSVRNDRSAEKPSNRSANTYSAVRTPSTSPRVTRAYAGQETTSAASTALTRLAPSAAATTIARMTMGNAMTRSVSRITVSSSQRPKNPAASPRMPPTTTESPTSNSASGTVTWAPARTRVNTSRPSSSVPNQWAPLGASSRAKSWASGP